MLRTHDIETSFLSPLSIIIPLRTLTLKDARPPYNVALDDTLLTDEVVILEKDGQPVAALVPMAEYAAFQSWREEERRRQDRQAEEAAIEREHAAFGCMLPELLKQYEGRVVAIYKGQVVDVGDDEGGEYGVDHIEVIFEQQWTGC